MYDARVSGGAAAAVGVGESAYPNHTTPRTGA